MEKIGTWHRPTREEIRAHPTFFEVVRRSMVRKYVHKELSTRLQRSGNFSHKELVILHVLEELNGDDSIEYLGIKLVVYNVPSDCL